MRVISEELWTRTHAVLAEKAGTFRRAVSGTLVGRPPATRAGRYLLSGLAQCGVCGGSIFPYARRHHAGVAPGWYRCHLHATRGAVVCSNGLWVPMAAVDALVLNAIEAQVFDAAPLDDYITEAVAMWEAAHAPVAARRASDKEELHRLDREIATLEGQLADGAPWRLIDAPLTARQQRRESLRADLAHADARQQHVAALDGATLRTEFGKRLADWRGLSARHPGDARHMLMRLLDGGRIVFQPTGRGKACEISGDANPLAVLTETGANSVVPQGALYPPRSGQSRDSSGCSGSRNRPVRIRATDGSAQPGTRIA